MRRKYYILWLDDQLDNSVSLMNNIKSIKNYVTSLAFFPMIETCKTAEEALLYCSKKDNRIDLFISDYNIDSDNDGLNFLEEVRKSGFNQDLILYSNNTKEGITREIISHLEESFDLSFFSRFTFESLADNNDFLYTVKKIINLSIEKWQELNGLRGLYLSEISQLEEEIKDRILHASDIEEIRKIYNRNMLNPLSDINNADSAHKNILNKVIGKKEKISTINFSLMRHLILDDHSPLHVTWALIAEKRNSMAHMAENKDSDGYYIISKKNSAQKFYEKDVIKYRKELLNFIDKIYEELNKLGL